jgi:hypothetical protein
VLPSLPAVPGLHERAAFASVGVSVLAHAKPYDPAVVQATVGSCTQLVDVDVLVAQQYQVEVPAGVPSLHQRPPVPGLTLPVHEYPVDPGMQPVTAVSAAHVPGLPPQQYTVVPPGPISGVLHVPLGVAVPVHEYPVDPP